MKKTGLIIVILIFLQGLAFADGKFYVPMRVKEWPPPEIPSQRAVIAHDGKKQLLILQSQFDGHAEDFGWVVPLPAVPELASLPQQEGENLFSQLRGKTYPSVVRLSEYLPFIWLTLLLILLAGAVALLVYKIRRKKAPLFLSSIVRSLLMIVTSAAAIFILYENQSETLYFVFVGMCFLILLATWIVQAILFLLKKSIPDYISIISGTITAVVMLFTVLPYSLIVSGIGGPVYGIDVGASYRVEILKAAQIGVYDVKVIKADRSDALIEWLKENGYHFNDSDKDAFDDYIKRGWCFTATKVSLSRLERTDYYWTGYVRPLAVLFGTENPVYPLMLTGTVEGDTDVVLYVFSKNKVEDISGRFTLKYASPVKLPLLFNRMSFEPSTFAEACLFETGYLTKLQASLSSEDMKEDLVLNRASNDKKYRETYYYWW